MDRAARLAASSDEPIPVFIFDQSSSWEYVGNYRCMGVSFVAEFCREKEQTYPERGDIVCVLRYRPVAEAA